LVPQGLGQVGIEYRPFGTKVDFLPIVLGNGRIRLEVRPEVSERDESIGIQLNDITVPGFRSRRADTAVEMQAGQTFALGGLIQTRSESQNRGLPILADIPGVGIPFRSVRTVENEIELIFLVTPELVDAMEPHEVPQCLPGMGTMLPNNHQLYLGGHVEVPNVCSPCGAANQGYCAPCCEPGHGAACGDCNNGTFMHGTPGYESVPTPPAYGPVPSPAHLPPAGEGVRYFEQGHDHAPSTPIHGELTLPPRPMGEPTPAAPDANGPTLVPRSAQRMAPMPAPSSAPQYVRSPQRTTPPPVTGNGQLMGPVGYDVE
jgi:pilus assembly protein CpaC